MIFGILFKLEYGIGFCRNIATMAVKGLSSSLSTRLAYERNANFD
jgi:hypothetical protein